MAASRTKAYRWRSPAALCSLWLAALAANVSGDCGPPPSVHYAIPEKGADSDSFPVDTTVRYQCDAGKHYVKIDDKSDTISCLEDSSWSPIEQFCKLQVCGAPTRFEYGELLEQYITMDIFPVDSIVMYKCRPGYVLKYRSIKPTIKCLPSLQWSTRTEFCQRKDCGNPGEPENGVVNVPVGVSNDPDTKFGSVVTFSCLKGFRLIGRNTRACTANGWSNDVPMCDPVLCGDPPDIANGAHSGSGQDVFQYLSAVTYTCNANYFRLSGSRVNYCTETGQWKEPAPECKDIRCSNPGVENGYKVLGFKSQYVVWDEVEFRCDEGFITNDSLRIHCVEEDKWVPKVPVCRPIVCGEPPAIANGSHSGIGLKEFKYHEYVTYQCISEDLSLIGDDKIQCIGDGYWSGKAPFCKDVLCEVPNLLNGKIANFSRPLRYKSIIVLECDMYFVLKGKPRIQCSENSTWIPEVPKCKDNRCSNPVVENGYKVLDFKSQYVVWDQVEFRCDEGFITHDSLRIHCEEEDKWVPKVPVCRPIVCGEPPAIANGSHSGIGRKEFKYHEYVTYQCISEDLSLIGDDKIQCVGDGYWSGKAPSCKDMTLHFVLKPVLDLFTPLFVLYYWLRRADLSCQTPVVENGKLQSSFKPPYTLWNKLKVVCNEGFILSGPGSITCNEENEWHPRVPRCRIVTCKDPYLQDGEVVTDLQPPFQYKHTVSFQCHQHFELKGANISTCSKNGLWNPRLPRCQRTSCTLPLVKNGYVTTLGDTRRETTFEAGKVYEVACNETYTLAGRHRAFCDWKYNWNTTFPSCSPILCPEPVVENGHAVLMYGATGVEAKEYRVSDKMEVRCNDGYALNGTDEIVCQMNSTWSSLPTCQFVYCDEPHVDNGHIVCKTIIKPALESRYRLSDDITFQCNDGYTMNGTNHIHCKEDSKWSTLPTCELGSRFLSVEKLILNKDEHQAQQKDKSTETNAKKICLQVFQNINENWKKMNSAEKETHTLLQEVCVAFRNACKTTDPQPETEKGA